MSCSILLAVSSNARDAIVDVQLIQRRGSRQRNGVKNVEA